MNTPFSESEPLLPEPEWNSLLDFTIEDVDPIRERLLEVTADDLLSFVSVRKQGASTDMLTTIYGADLTTWHHEQGREGDAAADLEYEGGLLYGKTLARTLFSRQMGRKLTPDDPDAYRVALGAVQRSYDEVPETCETPWERESFRELACTGSHLLSVLNAVLDDHTQKQIVSLFERYDMGDGIVDEDERVAFYRGLIDSVIFYNSYARWKERSLGPETFIEEAKASFAERQWCAEQAVKGQAESPAVFSLEFDDDIATFVTYLDQPLNTKQRAGVHLDGWLPSLARTGEVLRQTGPNEFMFVPEITHIEPLEEAFAAKDWCSVIRFAGECSMAGAAVQIGYDFIEGTHTYEFNSIGNNAGLLGGFALGLASWSLYKWRQYRRQRNN